MERKGCDSWRVLCFFARWWKPDFHHTSFVYICEYTKNPLEEGMETHSSILAWGMPWTEKPSELQSTGSQRAGHDWSDLACTHILKTTELYTLNGWIISHFFFLKEKNGLVQCLMLKGINKEKNSKVGGAERDDFFRKFGCEGESLWWRKYWGNICF